LTAADSRSVLVGARYKLDFESIRDSMILQCPEHKPPPAMAVPAGQQLQTQTLSPPAGGKPSLPFRKPPFNKFRPRPAGKGHHVNTSETIDEEDEYEEDHAEEELYEDEPAEEEQDADLDIEALHQVLTVTAQKLKHLTQGRKFTGGKPSAKGLGRGGGGGKGSGSKSIADRKKVTTCAICGELGHWQGDSECKGTKTNNAKGPAGHQVNVAEIGDSATASESVLSELGAVIDLVNRVIHFVNIGVSTALVKLSNGHLACSIVDFPPEGAPRSADNWKFLSPEIAVDPTLTTDTSFQPLLAVGQKVRDLADTSQQPSSSSTTLFGDDPQVFGSSSSNQHDADTTSRVRHGHSGMGRKMALPGDSRPDDPLLG
ncbi:unnamed protein product, partial [Polarella glacialis]